MGDDELAAVTFVLTDIEASSTLWEDHPETMSAAVARHDDLVAGVIEAAGGELVRSMGEGDSTFSAFLDAGDAAGAAVALLRIFAAEPWPVETPIRIRIGIYTGPGQRRGLNFYGTTANRAARLRAVAFAGQILLGSTTASALSARLPADSSLIDIGEHELRGMRGREHVFELRLSDVHECRAAEDDIAAADLEWTERLRPTTFVGRTAELARIDKTVAAAQTAGPSLLIIAGEPGIGKTALTAEAACRALGDGVLVLHGGFDQEISAPYLAFREALGAYAARAPLATLRADLRSRIGEISRLLPEVLDRVGGLRSIETTDGEIERLRLLDAVTGWLNAIASRHPVLLVLDDLQWADLPSLLVLRHLFRNANGPLVVLATLRSTQPESRELTDLIASIRRAASIERLSLNGFSQEEVAVFASGLAGQEVAVTAAERLRKDTAGNPFFVAEIVRHLIDLGPFGADPLPLPESLKDVVRARLARLSDSSAGVLATAALAGDSFNAGVVGSAVGLDQDHLLDALDEAEQAGMLIDGVSNNQYSFSHAVVRQALIESQSAARRALRHRRLADALGERQPAPAAAELAYHYVAAAPTGCAEKAVQFCRLAAREAMAARAYEAARDQSRKALELIDEYLPDAYVLRSELLFALAGAHDAAGEFDERDHRFLESAEWASKARRPDLLARAALGYGGTLPAAADPDRKAIDLLETALAAVGEGDSTERARMLGRLAQWLHFISSHDQRRQLCDDAVEMARRLRDKPTLAEVLLARVFALDTPGDIESQILAAREILRLGQETDDHVLEFQSWRAHLDAAFELGDIETARVAVAELSRLAAEAPHPEHLRMIEMWDIVMTAVAGQFDKTVAAAETMHARLRRSGHPQADMIYFAEVFPVRWLQGRLGELESVVEQQARNTRDPLIGSSRLAWVLAEQGEVRAARAILASVPPRVLTDYEPNFQWWAIFVGLADAACIVGDEAWAATLYDTALPFVTRHCTVGLSAYLGAVAHHLAGLATTLGRWDDAHAHYRTALAGHLHVGARPFAALSQLSWARLLERTNRSGDCERAAALIGEGQPVARELGLRTFSLRAPWSYQAR